MGSRAVSATGQARLARPQAPEAEARSANGKTRRGWVAYGLPRYRERWRSAGVRWAGVGSTATARH